MNATRNRAVGWGALRSRTRDGGVEDGLGAAAAAEPVATVAVAIPPVATPPFIAVVAGPLSPWRARHGTEPAAAHPMAARLRVPDLRRAALPLSAAGALRSQIASARRSPVFGTPSAGEPRPTSHGDQAPAPSCCRRRHRGRGGGTVPPPAAVSALIVAALALAGAAFSVLVLRPARPRPVLFISLLERPG